MNDCGRKSKRTSPETQNTVDTLCMSLMDVQWRMLPYFLSVFILRKRWRTLGQ